MKVCLLFAALLLPFSAWAAPCETVQEGLKKCGNLPVLYLTGKPEDRARQMGAMRGISPAVIDYFSHKIIRTVQPSYLRSPFTLALNQIVRLLHRRVPGPWAEELDALAAGFGLDSIELKRAASLPDIATMLQGVSAGSAGGCTSVAWKDKNGHFVMGRNLDFGGVGAWDAHPLLVVVSPEAGSAELKHLVFSAHGMPWGGITGVNEAGISFAVHQNYTRDQSLSGLPMVLLGEMVLRKARTLEEAVEILRANRPPALWTFVLTDIFRGRSMAVESSSRHFAVRESESELVQTNHVHDPEIRKWENMLLPDKTNSVYRHEKAMAMLGGSAATASAAAEILSYQENPLGEISAYQDILKANTIQTVVLSSNLQNKTASVHMSVDPAPTASGRFVTLDFAALLDPARELVYEEVVLSGTKAEKRERQRAMSEAFQAYFEEEDPGKALPFLSSQKTLDAILFQATSLYQLKRYAEAVALGREAENPRYLSEPAYILQSLQWVRLASLVGMERKEDAQRLADQLLNAPIFFPKLEKFAQEVLRGKKVSPPNLKFQFFSGGIHERPY